MMNFNLEYKSESLLPLLNRKKVTEFEKSISRSLGRKVRLPDSFVDHMLRYHGGVPGKKCFATASGAMRFIGRFLNFLRAKDVPLPVVPTWRVGVDRTNPAPEDDIRLDYSIWRIRDGDPYTMMLGDALIPFAGIDTAGHDCRDMAEFDLLCFNYDRSNAPSVVAWSFHESWEDEPATEDVAESFETFVPMLEHCPNSLIAAHRNLENF